MKRPAVWLLLGCWLLILLAPPLRSLFWIQASGRGEWYRGWMWGPFPGGQTEMLSSDELAKRFPDDPRILAVAVDKQMGSSIFGLAPTSINDLDRPGYLSFQRNQVRDYDALIRRFPQENWLVARRLQATIATMRQDRVGGKFSDPDEARGQKGLSPERVGKPNYTPQELNEAIAVARLGQKREPDNAFYDWTLFYFLMIGWRDDEAWRVLAKGSHKPRFDAHHSEWTQALVAAHEAKWGRPLLVEESLGAQAIILFPIFARDREMGRIIEWEGLKAGRKRGNHAKALQIYTDSARLNALHARQSYSGIEALVAHAMVAIVMGVEGKALRSDMTPTQWQSAAARARIGAYKFARYANKHGRPDLAREMTALRLAAGHDQDRLRASFRSSVWSDGMAARPLINAVALYWAAAIILLLVSLLAVLWLTLGAVLRRARVREVSIARRDVGLAVLFGAIAAALCIGSALYWGAGWQTVFAGDEAASGLLHCLLASGAPATALIITGFCWFVSLLWEDDAAETSAPRAWPTRLQRALESIRLSSLLSGFVWLVCLFGAALFWILLVARGGQAYAVPPFGVLATLYSYLGVENSELTLPAIAPLWAELAFAAALLVFPLRWIFGTPAAEKSRAAYRLRLLHASLGTLIVVASGSYLLLLVASLPVRAQTDAQMQQRIQRGEVAMMLQNAPAVKK